MVKECTGVSKVEDEGEEEDLVEVVVRLSATTVNIQGTMHKSAKILHTHHVNIADSLTIL